jgi:hypothetical protein
MRRPAGLAGSAPPPDARTQQSDRRLGVLECHAITLAARMPGCPAVFVLMLASTKLEILATRTF